MLFSPRIQAITLLSVNVFVTSLLESVKGVADNRAPLVVPVDGNVNTRRAEESCRLASRSICATPPFSTIGPSGLSLFLSLGICGVPLGIWLKYTLLWVQKLLASLLKNPLSPSASWEGPSGRIGLPPSRPISYCFKLPIQRGSRSLSGRNIAMNTWFRYEPWVVVE